jgi:hypothetical protein
MKTVMLPVVVLAFVFSALGQSVDEEPGKNELQVWSGFAPAVRTFRPTGGRTWDARLGIGALRYSHRWNTSDWVNIKYTMDAVPVLVLNYPDIRRTSTGNVLTKETRYAFGGSPIGLQGNFRPRKKLQPFIAMSLGVLIFNKTTPNDLGKRLNFSTEGGGGIEYRLKDKKALTFGYKFYHISNASRGEINPGYDAQMLYLGYTFYSK